MNRREQWRKVLDAEVQRWSAKTDEQVVAELCELQAYEVEFDSNTYQVEVEILENAAEYVHVMLAVDDGSLPASISPLTETFMTPKPRAAG
jgi:hypothetical protein